MANDFKYDVFLSYSSKDSHVVRNVAERLRADGLQVWFDEWEISAGDNIPSKLEEGLASSRVLVLFMSANAFGSDWTQLETGTFRFRDPLNKERSFIPLRLDDAPLKDSLAQFLYINWVPDLREQRYPKLLEACKPPAKPMKQEVGVARELGAEKIMNLSPSVYSSIQAFSPDGKRGLSGSDDNTVRLWDLGREELVRVFKGHTDYVHCMNWSTDPRFVISGSDDTTIRLWDVDTGDCLRVLEGHAGQVWAVAWSVSQKRAVTGGQDQTMRVWDTGNGKCLHVLEGHTGGVRALGWGGNRDYVIAADHSGTLRQWDMKTGQCLHVLKGHSEFTLCVAMGDNQRQALSGSGDTTVRLWELGTGRCLRIFEGHTNYVTAIAYSADQRLALSGSFEGLRLWDVETGSCLCVLKGHESGVGTVMWSANGRRAFSADGNGEIRVWDLSEFVDAQAPKANVLSLPAAQDQVQYANAKILLVGDTGVGKSGLAERLVHKRFVTTKSSHARKAYVLESHVLQEPGGVLLHQEAVLWDLAGQPAYRLVHQLSMEDAALACVLFDCRNETNPFEGAAYWAQVLEQARTSTKLKKLLVASRVDVGGLPAGIERIKAFVNENGFEQFLPTSAFSGEGCDKLLEAIRRAIPWDELPKVTTTNTLAALREFVATLKGEKGNQKLDDNLQPISPKLFTVAELHEGFVAHFGEKIPEHEFIAHLQRLEATDAVDLLVFYSIGAEPSAETPVLLDPTRVDAYASALLVAAKDEPDGPGHLLEARVREGEFRLDKDERLVDRASERQVLWYVMENLLSRDLALRERIKDEDYIVFPSQCTAELKFPSVAAFGVAFGFAGPVRSIYATLIAQLAHYEGFKKREFFQDAAAYRAEEGGRCLVRLRDQAGGKGELEVLFDSETPSSVRQGFLEFVGKHLEAKSAPGSVTKRHAYHCANPKCGEPFEDRVVKARLYARKKDLLCPICEMKTALLDLLAAPTAAAESVAAQIVSDAKAGRQRMTAGFVIKTKEAEGKFDVFLSHNTKDKAAVEKIAKRLLKVGIRPWLDKWNLPPGARLTKALAQAIETIPCAALFFGPADVGNWHIMEIDAYLEKWAKGDARMIPVILPDVKETPEIPIFVRQPVWADMRDWEKDESDAFYRLVCGVLGKAPGDSPMKKFGARDVAEWQGAGA